MLKFVPGASSRQGAAMRPGSSRMWVAIMAGVLAVACLACDKGPAQKAGGNIDKAVDSLKK